MDFPSAQGWQSLSGTARDPRPYTWSHCFGALSAVMTLSSCPVSLSSKPSERVLESSGHFHQAILLQA